MNPVIEAFLALLILTGAVFTFVGALGLARLRDFYTRLHGPTKATTLGVGSLLIASTLFFSISGEGVSLHEILVTLFLFITAPVSAHLLCKAALHQRLPSLAPLPDDEERARAGASGTATDDDPDGCRNADRRVTAIPGAD